ncbi:MAG: PRC-barrel domain-containing protein [Alphaproteobacteria bacterium]|nr:PRC-barrel domain-containing protein [Alphaproteobacteria bacterium]
MSHTPTMLSATSINGDKVVNPQGEDLGKIEDLMIDLESGTVRYAVMSFGGFLGMGDKLFAVPMDALHVKSGDEAFVLNATEEKLKNAPGFDKDDWPNFADPAFDQRIRAHYA